MSDSFLILIFIAVFIVLGVLVVGIGGFAKGGAFNAKHGNRMMRYRIAAQAVAVALIAIYVYRKSAGGGQ